MKKYGIKEVFGTLQGEGAQAGSPAIFLRFAGCNLGYEVCPWCDTDWVRADLQLNVGEVVSLVDKTAEDTFCKSGAGLLVVVTGGEPSLQFDCELSNALRDRGYSIAMESNGSRPIDLHIVDWLTISPKQRDYVQKRGHELKLVFTGEFADGIANTPEAVTRLTRDTDFDFYFLQPVDLPDLGGANLAETIQAVMKLGPPWRLSIQTHKLAGLP